MFAFAPDNKLNKIFFIAASILLLTIAFYQCYKTTHDLNWAADPDFDRDISFARGTLQGHYGKDPNYKGEYLWYNPMLFSIEAAIAKTTSLPLNVVAVRTGTYLNILAPVAFFFMAFYLFGSEIGLAALLSFLFLASGNIQGWGSATYTPWLYPVCFAQFLFYINVMLCYKAFESDRNTWFVFLGISIGITFLSHSAPALLSILIIISLQSQKIFSLFKERKYALIRRYFFQGIITFVLFVIAAMPLLYYVFGRYHLHLINRATFEYTEGIFIWRNYKEMIKANLSVSFFVAVVGFVWFYRNFQQQLIRRIILSWLYFTIIMYIYSTLVSNIDGKYHIHLPGTVPSFHYFFYLKALQSIFFGFGFLFLINPVISFLKNKLTGKKESGRRDNFGGIFFVVVVLICAFAYFPFYKNREDFVLLRQQAIEKENQTGKIEVYNYIIKNIPEDKVILCDIDPSIFPVMATARKMVAIRFTFSNPYLDFDERDKDRNNMILFLKTGEPADAKKLFGKYDTDYVLLEDSVLSAKTLSSPLLGTTVFKNKSFTIFSLIK